MFWSLKKDFGAAQTNSSQILFEHIVYILKLKLP